MGDVIKDFYKSDAPQFKGRSKEKRREMAIAAKLTAERGPQNEAASEVAMSPAELALQKKKTMIDKMITMKRQQALGKTKTEEVEVDEKYQGMYQSPTPTYNRLKSSDEKARMSPGRRAMAKSDELEKSEPGSKRAKAQKKASMQMARNFKSARATTEEVVREGDGDPCWDTHKQVGMKKKGGKMVPNCVPKEEVEVSEEGSMSQQEIRLQKRKAMIDQLIAKKRKQSLDKSKGSSETPAKAMGEAKELSIDAQMKISRDHNRKSPEEKKAANSKLLGAIKKVKREKDTRTDAQKMTDATGPRPGSRYRGD